MPTILEKITALIAGLTVLLIALSASHEFGYFAYLGGGFFQTFVSASDYLTNAFLWLPLAVITAAGWWNSDWLWKEPPRPKMREWKTWIFPGVITLLPVLSFVFLSEGIPVIYLALFVYVWALFADKNIPGGEIENPLAVEARKLIKVGVPVCAALFTLGYINASNDMHGSTRGYSIHIKGSQDPIIRIPLRNFDKGILVRNAAVNEIDYLPWERIESVTKHISSHSEPLSCKWFGLLCGEKRAAAP